MPRSAVRVSVSLTETAQFRRLVRFLAEADDWAWTSADDELAEMVEQCRQDLLERKV